jgi:glycogen debranching enzyme
MRRLLCPFMLVAAAAALLSQSPGPIYNPLPPIAFDASGPVIGAHTEALKPFTVAGERGVLVGQQDGTFEAWLLPVKVLSHLTIEAEVEGYTVPIDVNQQSAEIEVRPDRTVITYAHIGFTVRQIMFSPANAPAGTGPVVLFEFDCLHPTDFTLRFTPELRWMWPERNEGVPSVEWVAPAPNAYEHAGGFYVLHSDYPDFAAAVAIPGTRPGILAPYQERPQVHPVEFKLHIDPARDHDRLFPLLMAYGTNIAASNSSSLAATLEKLNSAIPALYQTHSSNWKKTLVSSVSIETPDKALNEAFQWAVISIEQLKTRTIAGQSSVPDKAGAPGPGSPRMGLDSRGGGLASENWDKTPEETALVAGYYASGDSARPGFGWFFGRDALYTLYAVNGYGDFSLSRSELEFLIHRQRADGKIMHEWSQTAAAIDWRSFPYMYAAADATPLFLLATLDYVRASGDVAFLTAHHDAIEKAWEFEISHAPGPDKGGNGIYDNTQGTGWVESWPGGMPHQEIYLALLDQQASGAMAQIEDLLHDKAKSDAARLRSETIQKTIEAQFYDQQKECYAFSRNAPVNGTASLDRTTTVYPALAWWSSPAVTGNSAYLAHPEGCLRQLAAHTLNTDWGLRDVSNEEKIYDGMSYHQGSVWPLFTGWAALAEYRGNQPLAGYQMLMENANLTRAQDLGADTELLSGDFFVPFGRSTSHQLWSSAMVITPTLRGLFGIDIDAQSKTITVNPHLPADWNHADLLNLQLPGGRTSLHFVREAGASRVSLDTSAADGWRLRTDLAQSKSQGRQGDAREIKFAQPEFEVSAIFQDSPTPGRRTTRARILNEERRTHTLILALEGEANSTTAMKIVDNRQKKVPRHPRIEVDGGLSNKAADGVPGVSLGDPNFEDNMNSPFLLMVNFPPGEGWKTITVTLTW